MTDVRHEKIARIADDIPGAGRSIRDRRKARSRWSAGAPPTGPSAGPSSAAGRQGISVSHIHLRHLNPLPRNLGDLLAGFDKVLVPEMNMGQLTTMLRSRYLVPAVSLPKVTGKPFKIVEIMDAIRAQSESMR